MGILQAIASRVAANAPPAPDADGAARLGRWPVRSVVAAASAAVAAMVLVAVAGAHAAAQAVPTMAGRTADGPAGTEVVPAGTVLQSVGVPKRPVAPKVTLLGASGMGATR